MTSRERIMAILTGQPADRISWAPLLDGYFTTSLPEQNMPEMDELGVTKYTGADLILRHVHTYNTHHDDTITITDSTEGDTDIKTISTPVGSVSIHHLRRGRTSFKTKPFVEDIEDIRVMKYIAEHASYSLNLEAFRKVSDRIGDYGIATVSMPLTPIQQLLQHDADIETFTYLLYDYEDEMREYMNVVHKRNLEQYRLLASTPDDIKVMIAYEDTSTTVMSPAWFEEFCLDELNEYARILHEGNKIFITHMCGKLTGMLPMLKRLEVDGFDSVCPPTTGDLEACDALRELPGKVIIGGIEPPMLQRMTAEQTREYAARVLDACVGSGRFILSTGDATPYGTPIENLSVVAELVNKL